MPSPEVRSRMRCWAGLLLALSLWASPVAAQQSSVHRDFDGIQVTTLCTWPTGLKGGYVPVHIRLHNATSERARVGLNLMHGQPNWSDRSSTHGSMILEPNQTVELDWLVLHNLDNWADNYHLQVEVNNSRHSRFSVHRIDSRSASSSQVPLLLVAENHALLTEQVNGESVGNSLSWVTGGSAPGQLPSDWRAYSSVAGVALDPEGGTPEAAKMTALLDFVALGGFLIVAGERTTAERLLAPYGDFFRGDNLVQRTTGTEVWRHRFGRMVVAPSGGKPLLIGPDMLGVSGLAGLSGLSEGLPEGVFPSALAANPIEIPGVDNLPLTGLTLVLLLFVLLIGPVQGRLTGPKSGRPYRLLILTPALGLGFSVAIFAFSLFSQGLGVKEAVASVTWLDQHSRQASTLAVRQVFSGSVLRPDLNYPATATVRPLATLGRSEGNNHFETAMNDNGVFRGDYLPVRRPVREQVAGVAAERGRLAIEHEGGAIYAVNGFDFDLPEFFYRDEQGAFFSPIGDDLPAGQRLELLPTDDLPSLELRRPESASSRPLTTGLIPLSGRSDLFRPPYVPPVQPKHSFLARPATSAFVPDGGVARTQVVGTHLLIGTLEPGS